MNAFDKIHQHQQQLKDSIVKGFTEEDQIQAEAESLEKAENDEIQKGGKRAFVGEVRTFAGREYIKTTKGWAFHGKGGGKKAQEHKSNAHDHHAVERYKEGTAHMKDHEELNNYTIGFLSTFKGDHEKIKAVHREKTGRIHQDKAQEHFDAAKTEKDNKKIAEHMKQGSYHAGEASKHLESGEKKGNKPEDKEESKSEDKKEGSEKEDRKDEGERKKKKLKIPHQYGMDRYIPKKR